MNLFEFAEKFKISLRNSRAMRNGWRSGRIVASIGEQYRARADAALNELAGDSK